MCFFSFYWGMRNYASYNFPSAGKAGAAPSAEGGFFCVNLAPSFAIILAFITQCYAVYAIDKHR
jgi:hypothetical protein